MKVVFTYKGQQDYQHWACSPTDRAVIAAVKKAVGLRGVRCVRRVVGNDIELRPVGKTEYIAIRFLA